MNNLIYSIGIGATVTIGIFGVLGAITLCLMLVDKIWSLWIDSTKMTVWFFDYVQNRRKFELWLEEKEYERKNL